MPPTEIAMEACGGSHHWARKLSALGHEVRLIPPQYVKPYVKRGKNDRNDAEAICEAGGRPGMRFVPVKTVDQQAQAMVLKVRATLVDQRTQLINALRGHAAEFGVVAGERASARSRLYLQRSRRKPRSRPTPRRCWRCSVEEIDQLDTGLNELEAKLSAAMHKANAISQLLATIPGDRSDHWVDASRSRSIRRRSNPAATWPPGSA